MAQLILYGKLHLLPVGGRLSTGAIPPHLITGFFTIDSLLAWKSTTFHGRVGASASACGDIGDTRDGSHIPSDAQQYA